MHRTTDKTTTNTANGEDRTGQTVDDQTKPPSPCSPGIKIVKAADKTEVDAGGTVAPTRSPTPVTPAGRWT